MRFEVRYPAGEPHEVELQGSFAVLGRDPSCDLVLNDVKCSRRHAVLEAGPDGLSIRDTESANGIFVNGQKVERAKLQERDLVRLGEIVLRVLPEQITGTVVMGPEDLVDIAPATARPAPSPPRATAPRRPLPPTAPLDPTTPSAPFRAERQPAKAQAPAPKPAPAGPVVGPSRQPVPARPLTVTVLSLLWIASILLYGGAGTFLAVRGGLPSPFGLVAAILGGVLAVLGAVMAFGLWTLKPWARFLQIAVAGIGLLACPMTLASATILVYMLRKPVALWFSGRRAQDLAADEVAALDLSAETTFTLTFIAMVALGVVATVGGLYLGLRRP